MIAWSRVAGFEVAAGCAETVESVAGDSFAAVAAEGSVRALAEKKLPIPN